TPETIVICLSNIVRDAAAALLAIDDARPTSGVRAGSGTAPTGGQGSTPSSSGTSRERRSWANIDQLAMAITTSSRARSSGTVARSEEHTSELPSRENLVCRLLLENKKNRQEE